MFFEKKEILVRESGLLEGFCDWHCHLLPGVDDGVEESGESLEILKLWEEAGVKEVWMTPHIMEDMPNKKEDLLRRFNDFKEVYKGGIELHLAAEHMMDGEFLKRINENENENENEKFNENENINENEKFNENGNEKFNENENENENLGGVLAIGENQDMMLVETSYYIPPMNMEEIIDLVKRKGYTPILAHPERYQYMGKNDYMHWKDKGVLLQLNIGSVVGAYGYEVQRKAEWLLKQDMYDLCGSDTHSIEHVEFFLNSMIRKKTVKRLEAAFATR